MIPNKPYMYLHEDNGIYYCHVTIFLKGYRFYDWKKTDLHMLVTDDPTGAGGSYDPKDEHPRRVVSGDPYEDRSLRKTRIKIRIEPEDGYWSIYHQTFPISHQEIEYGLPKQADFVQVLIFKNDADQHHDGSSSGHYGDPD